MFKRIIEVKDHLSTIAINYIKLDNLTNDDIHILEKYCEILQVFKDIMEEISREKQITISKVYI